MNDYDSTSHSPAVRRLLPKKKGGWLVAAGLTGAVAGLVGAGTSASAVTSSPSSASAAGTPAPSATPTGGGPRSGPADGGATGLVDTTSASGFTMTTATGVVVTVTEASSTTYERATERAKAGAVKKGASVLVLGLVNNATITASKVIVQPRGDGGAAAAKAAGVIPFQPGVPSPVKTVGQVPSNYVEGQGTIVSGTAAYQAAKAAQKVFPGGIADRVVVLSDGEYEVHNISINWPHHVFVTKDFKAVGAF